MLGGESCLVEHEFAAADAQQWVLQPLIDAGVDRDQIEVLLYRLSFGAIVGGGGPPHGADPLHAVADQPPAVRAAWVTVIERLMTTALETA